MGVERVEARDSLKAESRDYADLKRAVQLLESPSLTAMISDLLGTPAAWLVKKLPTGAQRKIAKAVEAALHKAVNVALWTMDKDGAKVDASPKLHALAVAASGVAGGFFGVAGSVVEIPVTTTLIMRSIADVARSEGFDIRDLNVQTACISVLGLKGGKGKDSEETESAYLETRYFLQQMAGFVGAELQVAAQLAEQASKEAGKQLNPQQAGKGLADLILYIANRFNIPITEKVAAQAAPVIGAVTAAALNTMFISFYQDMARGHFIFNRLARVHGEEAVRTTYEEIRKGLILPSGAT